MITNGIDYNCTLTISGLALLDHFTLSLMMRTFTKANRDGQALKSQMCSRLNIFIVFIFDLFVIAR